MRTHALRHILLKALAFGIIAMMLTDVCAAQEDIGCDEDEFGKLKWMESYQPKDSVHLHEYIDSYKAYIERWKGKSTLADGLEIYIAMAEFERRNYDTVERIAIDLINSNESANKYAGLELLTKIALLKKDFTRALELTIQNDTTSCHGCVWCGNGIAQREVKLALFYADSYAGLGDTASAVKHLLKAVFKDYLTATQKLNERITELLKNRFSKKYLKREFDNSLEKLSVRNVDNWNEYYFTFLNNEVVIPADLNYFEKAKTKEDWRELVKNRSFYKWLSN